MAFQRAKFLGWILGLCGFVATLGVPSQGQVQSGTPASPLQSSGRLGGAAVLNQPTALSVTPEGLADLRLAPGNLITVHVFEEPDLDGSYRVDSDGDVAIPNVGSIRVASLSLREAEVAIDKRLVAGEILLHPHVTVNISDYGSHSVVVVGEVNAPGRLTIVGARTLQHILAMAGGTTPYTGDEILIQRVGQPADKAEKVHFNRAQGTSPGLDTLIYPGDSVVVKRAGTVYVLGAVSRPGGYIMQESGTLNIVEALALASGTVPEASISKIRLLRKSEDGNWTSTPVPLGKIQKGLAAATPLQAEDVVYVPPSTIKEVGINLRSLLSGVAGATIYILR